jgi:hypothetical protein
MGHVVLRKLWRDPALQAPVTKDEEEKKGKQPKLFPFPDKEKGKQEDKDYGEKNTGKVGQVKPRDNSGHEGQQQGNKGPGINVWRVTIRHVTIYSALRALGTELPRRALSRNG